MNKESSNTTIILLKEAGNYDGGDRNSIRFRTIGYLDGDLFQTAEDWVKSAPDGFTLRKIELVEELNAWSL